MQTSDDNKQSLKPSKRFFIRGGIATGIIVLILIVQTPWFSNLFSGKNSKGLAVSDATVGEIVGKDSNGNGIADWEERLWGLDPTVSTTNGISNKSIIEAKRKTLQNNGNVEVLNETNRLARELFSITSALSQESSLSSQEIGELVGKLSDQSFKKDTTPKYTLKDIKTTKTTIASLSDYEKQIGSIMKTYNETSDIELFFDGVETKNYSNFPDLIKAASQYENISKKLKALTVPIGVADYHLQILNSFNGFSSALYKMSLFEDNSIIALVGLAEYRELDTKMEIASAKLILYFEQYGII